MKLALMMLALVAVGITSCERHKFEDVKVLHQSHGDHGDHGGDSAHGEKKAEH
jgi:hypothetical protein